MEGAIIMVILSQDKKEIVNFDNIMNIETTDCDEDGYGIFAGFIVGRDDNYRILGYYKTEERAKEILQDILKKANSRKYLLKSKAHFGKKTIKGVKEYLEALNGIELIAEDAMFDIVPTGNSEEAIYEMPER